MKELYNGLELRYTNWTTGEKQFWHEKAHDGSLNWEIKVIQEDGQPKYYGSDLHEHSDRPDLGKFRHILKTDNNDFEFRIFEKGILKVLKTSAKQRVQKELDNELKTIKLKATFY